MPLNRGFSSFLLSETRRALLMLFAGTSSFALAQEQLKSQHKVLDLPISYPTATTFERFYFGENQNLAKRLEQEFRRPPSMDELLVAIVQSRTEDCLSPLALLRERPYRMSKGVYDSLTILLDDEGLAQRLGVHRYSELEILTIREIVAFQRGLNANLDPQIWQLRQDEINLSEQSAIARELFSRRSPLTFTEMKFLRQYLIHPRVRFEDRRYFYAVAPVWDEAKLLPLLARPYENEDTRETEMRTEALRALSRKFPEYWLRDLPTTPQSPEGKDIATALGMLVVLINDNDVPPSKELLEDTDRAVHLLADRYLSGSRTDWLRGTTAEALLKLINQPGYADQFSAEQKETLRQLMEVLPK